MSQHGGEALIFKRGEERVLPHTLEHTRHLTLTLIDFSATDRMAVFELHNPEAEPDSMINGLVEQTHDNAERVNRRRDKLHLPETTVPVDTSTMPVEVLHCRLHEKLLIGDRTWHVAAIDTDEVTLKPGHDFEAPSLLTAVEDVEYSKEALALAEDVNTNPKVQ